MTRAELLSVLSDLEIDIGAGHKDRAFKRLWEVRAAIEKHYGVVLGGIPKPPVIPVHHQVTVFGPPGSSFRIQMPEPFVPDEAESKTDEEDD